MPVEFCGELKLGFLIVLLAINLCDINLNYLLDSAFLEGL
jgi:hypothetical protein